MARRARKESEGSFAVGDRVIAPHPRLRNSMPGQVSASDGGYLEVEFEDGEKHTVLAINVLPAEE